MNRLPFQGAPFRALFVYHVRMLRHLLFGKKRADIFLDFEYPTCSASFPSVVLALAAGPETAISPAL